MLVAFVVFAQRLLSVMKIYNIAIFNFITASNAVEVTEFVIDFVCRIPLLKLTSK